MTARCALRRALIGYGPGLQSEDVSAFGTKQTPISTPNMSAFGGKADIDQPLLTSRRFARLSSHYFNVWLDHASSPRPLSGVEEIRPDISRVNLNIGVHD